MLFFLSIKGKEVKHGTSLDKLRGLVTEASDIQINFDYELRPVKTAISAADAWIAEHLELLQSTGLLRDSKRKSYGDEFTDTIVTGEANEETTVVGLDMDKTSASSLSYSLEDLEQLQLSANQLTTVFPALR